ncbi:MAG: ribosomal protein methylthiotransferase [Bacillota bacterium]|nr:ribosomal protein methylthiotransferase [Bacillota bacterium]
MSVMSEAVALVSLGCAKNLVDSEVMAGLLTAAGYRMTSFPGDADVIVVNTCAFIGEAQQEAVDTILDLAKHKEAGRCRALVVTGCLAQRFASELLAEIPEIDAVVGTGDFPLIADVVRRALSGERVRLVGTPCYLYDENAPRILSTPPYMAYVKIAEGCSNQCSYCVIPDLRGPYRSRPMESIIAEVRKLARGGAKELILIAQDTTRYGEDIYGHPSLARLLREVCKVDGPRWVRVLYMYPTRVTGELIEVMASEPKICKYVDLPLQHADDDILRAMNRRGTSDDAREIIARFRQAMPDVTIRSTFIVGFPGETDEKFGRLLDFLKEVRLDRVGVFAYSPQPGTPAARLHGRVPARVKERRRREAMEVQKTISREKNEARVGKVFDVLIEGRSEESDLVTVGRSQAEAPEIDGLIYIGNEHPAPGEFRRVRIVDAGDYDLVGETLAPGAGEAGDARVP